MSTGGAETVGSALAAFRDANRLRHDERDASLWLVRFGGWALPLPNFQWRRDAIDAHDAHHMITGFPCTAAGEFQIAAWEFGAGRYPHWGAAACCGALLLIGLIWMPGEVRAAYRLGRGQRSLYVAVDLGSLLETPLERAQDRVRGPGRERSPAVPWRTEPSPASQDRMERRTTSR